MKNISTAETHFLPTYMLKSHVTPRLLVVDDDPLFGKIMKRAAACFGAQLTFVQSVAALTDYDLKGNDVAIIDFDLDTFTGLELVRSFGANSSLPIVLVSAVVRHPDSHWSDSIYEFLVKDRGPLAIIDAAFEAHEIAQLNAPARC